jgi:L-2-aminoadipate reductase
VPRGLLTTLAQEIDSTERGILEDIFQMETVNLMVSLADKTVECAGRADDQVKIRGFRIELGEIDTFLSQHPLVRENVTLVRRDKDEEPTLVSYIVPQHTNELADLLTDGDDDSDAQDELVKGLRKYRKLIRNIREHLKGKLPAYAVPTGSFPTVMTY